MDLGAEHSTEHSAELPKCTYGGMHRWLPEVHPYRSAEMVNHMGTRPKPCEDAVVEQVQHAEEYAA